MENYPDRISAQTLAAAMALSSGSSPSPSPGKVYYPAGSITFSELPALSAERIGAVYNITNSFTTTSDFTEGAGKSYPAGTNVAIVNTGTNESPILKYDCMMGDLSEILENISDIQELIPSSATTSNKLATASDVADENISATSTNTSFSLTDATNGRIQGLTVEGRTTKTSDVINNVGDNGFGVTSCSKNILKATHPDVVNYDTKTLYGVTFTIYKNNDGNIEKVVANGTATNDAGLIISDKNNGLLSTMRKYAGKTVTLSGCPAGGSQTTYSILVQGFQRDGIGEHDTGNGVTLVVTDPIGFTKAYQIIILIRKDFVANNLVFCPQLELGSAATTFEPYKGSTASLTTGLPLCSVGSIKDEVDYNRGVVIKRTAKIVLNGTETGWGIDTNATTGQSGSKRMILLNAITGVPVENNQPFRAVCDKLQVATAGETYGDNDGTISTDIYGTTICVRITGIATVSDLTTYLTSNPVTVVYELAEPYEVPMTAAEVTAYRNLRTYEDTANITATDSPTMTVDYLLDTENGKAVGKVVDDTAKQMLNLLSLIAAPYDETETYALGAYCTENNTLYKCTTAVSSAEPFDPEKWTATTIMAEI